MRKNKAVALLIAAGIAVLVSSIVIPVILYRDRVEFDPAGFLNEIVSISITLSGALAVYYLAEEYGKVRQRLLMRKSGSIGYRERMEKLSAQLSHASAEADKALKEIAVVVKAREESLEALELRVDELSKHEHEMQTRIDSLRNVSLPAVEYFLEASERGEKRSALRDYVLFGLGVVVSTLVAVFLDAVFGI